MTSSATTVDAPYFPPDVGKPGSRPLPISDRIYIDRDDWRDDPPADYKRLALGRTVRLRHGYCITADEVVARDADGVTLTKHRARHARRERRRRKGAGVIHWVDAATSVPAEVRLYERLFKVPQPEEGGGDFLEHLDRELARGRARRARRGSRSRSAAVGSRWQLERVGYFIVDEDTKPGALVLNRIITLRDDEGRAAKATAAPTEQKENAKAKTRPKSKSPAEYRAEARARDPRARGGVRARRRRSASPPSRPICSPAIARPRRCSSRRAARRGDADARREVDHQRAAARARRQGARGRRRSTRRGSPSSSALVATATLHRRAAKAVLAEMVATGKRAERARGCRERRHGRRRARGRGRGGDRRQPRQGGAVQGRQDRACSASSSAR